MTNHEFVSGQWTVLRPAEQETTDHCQLSAVLWSFFRHSDFVILRTYTVPSPLTLKMCRPSRPQNTRRTTPCGGPTRIAASGSSPCRSRVKAAQIRIFPAFPAEISEDPAG